MTPTDGSLGEPLFPDLPPPPDAADRLDGHPPAAPRCDACGRRIWSPQALTPRLGGRLLGSHCYAKARRTSARAAAFVAAFHIPPPGDIPGQAEIPLSDETLES